MLGKPRALFIENGEVSRERERKPMRRQEGEVDFKREEGVVNAL